MTNNKAKECEKAVALMKSGSTLGEAAAKFKISRNSLYQWMDQQGLERPHRRSPKDTGSYQERYQKMHDMVLKGAGITQTAKDLGVTLSSYYRWKGQQGVVSKGKPVTRRRKKDVTVHQMELAPTDGVVSDRIVALVGTPAQIALALRQML